MQCKNDIEDKEEEVFEVLESNAVVDPWAVMIHFQYAHVTDTAMVTAVRFVFVAPFAMAAIPKSLALLTISSLIAVRSLISYVFPRVITTQIFVGNCSRMLQHGSTIAPNHHRSEHAKNYQVVSTGYVRMRLGHQWHTEASYIERPQS